MKYFSVSDVLFAVTNTFCCCHGNVELYSGGSRISNSRKGAPTYHFAKFTENCMKMKEFGPRGRGPQSVPGKIPPPVLYPPLLY